jgi:hypothetical protein
VDCCFRELALQRSNSACWSSTKQTPSSSHQTTIYGNRGEQANYYTTDAFQFSTIFNQVKEEENSLHFFSSVKPAATSKISERKKSF